MQELTVVTNQQQRELLNYSYNNIQHLLRGLPLSVSPVEDPYQRHYLEQIKIYLSALLWESYCQKYNERNRQRFE